MRKVLSVVLLLGLVTALSAHDASGQRRRCVPRAECPQTLSRCPRTGCGGDPELNRRKNISEAAEDPEEWSLDRIINLNRVTPSRRRDATANGRRKLREVGEGTPVVTKGWLINAHVTGGREATNCFLCGPENNDFHLNLARRKSDGKERSVVIEITPRFRPDGWDINVLEALADTRTYVRVTGWLLFDTAHSSGGGGSRATAWEIHPVTKFEVCMTTAAECDGGSGWRLLERVRL